MRSGPLWRWIEIAFWAELGTLVGILFYVAGSLSEGHFLAEELTMFCTEILIVPVVVVAIFFLFNLTGITGISPQGTSITGVVGFAFIFGFAIRRTIGLLDNVKKRIFPEPTQLLHRRISDRVGQPAGMTWTRGGPRPSAMCRPATLSRQALGDFLAGRNPNLNPPRSRRTLRTFVVLLV